ncbi:unnamed protein product [Vitrella brassicaformis CCMP3155]|uniref:VOC domain-containing protein n=2 Tax=Vitrella brassicaformis TaxID=1169539 RepID=A0A0G4ENB1_VITBC|nr:unnamed protein product [Vitrella brassicaformis CCMP3155]|mmetsp:Transcript_4495/g.11917  ORF Transcript_4495/g.11917 Transcript_4495/m.11917 type:complete len:332 (-) Transcript_4495:998-1993(-)|eukprot:CEL98616.1 unnamed protein product [Vitrella brassicaformis CCMP3155]
MSPVVDRRRALHWVFKVGDLAKTLEFLSSVLGMRVLRHEEFEEGCEATCNGPYAGAWSKTMVGYGSEKQYFCFEITANYGVTHYDKGNDMRYIGLRCVKDAPTPWVPFQWSKMSAEAQRLGYAVNEADGTITGPDNYCYKLVPMDPQHKRAQRGSDPVLMVSLNVSDLAKSTAYWRDLLQMEQVDNQQLPGSTSGSVCLRFPNDHICLELVQLPQGREVEHKEAFGRIAFTTSVGPQPIFERVKAAGHTIKNEPITLKTPGKADVVVTILEDPDGYEICFVNEEGFYDLCEAVPGDDYVNYAERAKRVDQMDKFNQRMQRIEEKKRQENGQ